MVLEDATDSGEVVSEDIQSSHRLAVAQSQRTATNDSIVISEDVVESSSDSGILLGPFDAHPQEAILLIIGAFSRGIFVLDLDCGVDFLDVAVDLEGEGVEASQAPGGVAASPYWIEGITGEKSCDFD